MRHAPAIIAVDSPRLEEVLGRVAQALAAEDAALIRAVVASYRYVAELVDDKTTSIRRLRELLFGRRTEKTATVVGSPAEATALPHATPADPATDTADPNPAAPSPSAAAQRPAAPGHGRLAADAYRGAERVAVPHATLQAGDPCPACGDGPVSDKTPGGPVRITGQ